LLQQSGLGQFYELNTAPGTRIRATAAAAKWKFLDDPAVQTTLLDFADAKQARVTLYLPAIHCVACVWLLENLFKLHPGIGRSQVNFARREAAITFAPEKITFSQLAALLASIGYEPQFTLAQTEKPTSRRLYRKTWLQIGLAAFGFGNIMLMSLPFYLGLDSFSGPWFKLFAGWLSLALALPVVTFSASDFWRATWFSLRQRALVLEVPLVMGLTAIYLSSAWEVIARRGPGYCDSLCGLIFFLLCGRLFQKMTHDRLTFDRDYKGFFPLAVMRKTSLGEESVAISRLQVGDRIILRNSELLPADARLVSGEACIDYSFVTGEAEPVACHPGQHLYAGGRQTGGAIEVETVKPVAQSYLASLWDNEAFRKPRENDLNSLTNRYSRRFTKLIVVVAVSAAAFWLFRDATKSLKVFTSVLIVACPCAFALAAPLAYGTVQRILVRRNIYLKNALVIERMARVDTIVLDKTGTLTTADARGVDFVAPVALTGVEKRLIASLARHSAHPCSIRITKSLTDASGEWMAGGELAVHGFTETPGGGIEGEVAGRRVLLGSRAWLAGQHGITVTEPPAAFSRNGIPVAPGSSVSVAFDGDYRGAFALENSLRPEVERLIARLGDRFELALLSGDNPREAAKFKDIFGERAILRFSQSPADKLNFIRELQQRGKKVMMVGDGLNDAGALKQADVGVAVVERIGIFSPASDVILDAAELPGLARVLAYSRQTLRVVRAGFLISAKYNVVGVSIAAAGALAPIVCAILMPLSSATVVIFSCSVTAWLGRKLSVEESRVGSLPRAAAIDSMFKVPLITKEAA
jgi:Cu+-exporting ATPase